MDAKSLFSNLMNAALVDLLKELVILPIINVNADENWTGSVEGLFEHRVDLDPETES